MQSYYEINVSRDGQHYFATAPRSFTRESEATTALEDFRVRFPKSEGFSIGLTYWRCVGKIVQ